MAIVTAICNQFKQDILDGIHAAADVYKIALYTNAASLDKTTTSYTVTNEVVGTGYTAGGQILAGRANAIATDIAYLDFTDPVWPGSTITARGAMIYNSSKTNKSVAVFDFGSDIVSSSGNFTVQLPLPGATTAIIRAA